MPIESQFIFEQEYMAQYNPPGRREGDHANVLGQPEEGGIGGHMVDAMTHMIDWINPILFNPFERILGRQFTCDDCKYHIFKGFCKECTFCSFDFKSFILSDKIREQINHIMRECDDLGVGCHPRYFIREEMMYYVKEEPQTALMRIYKPSVFQFKQVLFRLELIL